MPLEDYIEARLVFLENEVERLTLENTRLRQSKRVEFSFIQDDMSNSSYIVTFENGSIKIEKEEVKNVD